MKKNTGNQTIGAQLVSASDGSAFTGTVTASVVGDNGTQTVGSVGSGVCTHKGNGYHTYTPSQSETNYDHIAFTFTGEGAVPVTIQVYPSFPQTGDTFDRVGANGSGLSAVPWNTAWDAEVQSECVDALNAYDPPTNSELNARTLASANYATSTDLAAVDGVADAIKIVTDKLDTAMVLDGVVYQFTENALENAPTGSGGSSDWSADERDAIRAILGIPASGSTPDDPEAGILDTIRDAVAALNDYDGSDTAGTTTLLARLTSDRAGYLDKLNVTGTLAHSDAAATYHADVSGLLTSVAFSAALPDNFAALGINASGHIERVTLVDTTTANTDMRGTDGANTTTPPTAASIADAVWDEAQADHVGAGTFGLYLDAAVSGVSTGGVTAADIADAVWDEALSGHVDAGSAGAELAATYSGTPPTAESISTQVASDLASAHGSGSWLTATGFATAGDVVAAQEAIIEHGDGEGGWGDTGTGSFDTSLTADEIAERLLTNPENKLLTNPDGSVNSTVSGIDIDSEALANDLIEAGVASEETLQKVLSKVNLLKSGLNVQYPFVSATGTIVLFEGFDFTDAGNAAIQITEAEVGQFDPTRMDIGSFQFYMRSQSSNDDYLGTATATKNADLWTLKAEIESEELPMKIGMYDWWFIATEVGTGDSDHFGIVHGTLELRRGMKVTC